MTQSNDGAAIIGDEPVTAVEETAAAGRPGGNCRRSAGAGRAGSRCGSNRLPEAAGPEPSFDEIIFEELDFTEVEESEETSRTGQADQGQEVGQGPAARTGIR